MDIDDGNGYNNLTIMKKVFIVEDDHFLTDIYVTKFEEKGYNVEAARDGEEALKVAEKKDFDIIILDINLPKIDGWEVLRRLRKSKRHRDCKVVILSNFDSENKETMKELGVLEHIIKIYHTPEEVVKEVEKYL